MATVAKNVASAALFYAPCFAPPLLNDVRHLRRWSLRVGNLLFADILLHLVHRLRPMLLRRMGVAENHVDPGVAQHRC